MDFRFGPGAVLPPVSTNRAFSSQMPSHPVGWPLHPPQPSAQRVDHGRGDIRMPQHWVGAWPVNRSLSSSASRAKHQPGGARTAHTLGPLNASIHLSARTRKVRIQLRTLWCLLSTNLVRRCRAPRQLARRQRRPAATFDAQARRWHTTLCDRDFLDHPEREEGWDGCRGKDPLHPSG